MLIVVGVAMNRTGTLQCYGKMKAAYMYMYLLGDLPREFLCVASFFLGR